MCLRATHAPPSPQAPLAAGEAEAVFGCGCFWGAEKGFWCACERAAIAALGRGSGDVPRACLT